MRWAAILVLAACCFAQAPPAPEPPSAEQLATRITQLMESTAVAVPGLVQTSEPLRRNAESTRADLRKSPDDPELLYLFMRQVRAYLALSDSVPRPSPFPAEADRQKTELRDDLDRLEANFNDLLRRLTADAQARAADPSDLGRYADANTKILPPGNVPRVVFLGDSITEGWRLNEYFTGRDFINRGIGGQTTLQMLGRFPADVYTPHPLAVLILAGIGDLARGISVGAIENHLAMMGDLARAHSIHPLFASVLPVSDYHKSADPRFEMTKSHPPDAIAQINRWLRDYCQKEELIYVDYYARMVDTSGFLQNDLSDDGLHPNSKGYRVMSPIAVEAIGRAIALAQQNPPVEPAKRRFRMLGK